MALKFDLAIIGGGINGCGIARDAAGRGLSVFLCEQGDLASATSSASTKLIHGGFRYLEHLQFRLVRESLSERETLLRIAPHIVHPMRFVLPHDRRQRPAWMIRLGLLIYDHLGARRELAGTRVLDLAQDAAGRPLRPEYVRAFEYSDCWADDARLVVLNAMDAADRGAIIATRTRCIGAERMGAGWRLTCEDSDSGAQQAVEARAIVNATGPWVARFLSGALHRNAAAHVRLVKGSHIVVRKLFDHGRAYTFQIQDGRVVFAIPYQDEFTLLGTTDTDHDGDPGTEQVTASDVAYICGAVNEYFRKAITPDDVVWSFAGVRPLYDDGAGKAQDATRDYVLEVDTPENAGALVSIFGGKLTTYRRLAESVLDRLKPALLMGGRWTHQAALPGGEFAHGRTETLATAIGSTHPFLAPSHARRLARSYGTRARLLLRTVRSRSELGRHFGADLFEVEVNYLMAHEWARSAEDVLWRRSKLGLYVSPAEAEALEQWMARQGQRQRAKSAS